MVVAFPDADEMRDYTNAPTSITDEQIDELVSTAVEWVETYCDTIFGRTEQVIEYIDGSASDVVYLDNMPIVSIDEVAMSFFGTNSYTIRNSTEYVIKSYGIRFRPTSIGAYQTKDINQIRVTYTYGFEDIPLVIKNCVKTLAGMYIAGLMYEKDSYLDSIKLGDATLYRKDYAKKRENVESNAKMSLDMYSQDSLESIR